MLFIIIVLFFSCAFHIDSELNKGVSYKSSTFDNDLLTGIENETKFICLKFELYALT